MTPQQRSKLGGLAYHARHGSQGLALAGQKGLMARFEREVDPDGSLAPEERQRRALAARRAHFTRIGIKGGKVKRRDR